MPSGDFYQQGFPSDRLKKLMRLRNLATLLPCYLATLQPVNESNQKLKR